LTSANGAQKQFQLLLDSVDACRSWNEALQSQHSESSRACAPKVNLAAQALAGLLQLEANPSGPQPTFGIFRCKVIEATIDIDDLAQQHGSSPAALCRRRQPVAEHAEAVYQQILAEQRLGFLADFHSKEDLGNRFGDGNWSALSRFPMWEKDKLRMIDNGKSGSNLTYAAATIHTTGVGAALALARAIRFNLFASSRGLSVAICGSWDVRVEGGRECYGLGVLGL